MDDIDELDRDLWERIRTLDLAAKVRLLSGQDKWRTWPEPAIGLHEIVMADSMVGVRGRHWTETDPSANTPSATATAATFDPEVAYELGRIVGAEARRKQVDVVLGPVVNLQRSPYGGRSFEGFGEDPQLAAVLAAAMVHGIEDEGVATTVKHFLANESETNRTTSNSVVDEQTLREVYLLPFEAVVQAGGQGMMSAYNRLNSTPASNTPLLNDIVKAEWGFARAVISDWNALRELDSSALGGTDIAMPGPYSVWAEGLIAAVEAGRVPEHIVDNKLLRLLRLAAGIGALDGTAPRVDRSTLPTPSAPDAPEVRERLRRAAARAMVLLRNQSDFLPLDPSMLSQVAVIGPTASLPRINGGGSASVVPPPITTPLAAISEALTGVQVRYAEGARPGTLLPPLTAAHGHAPTGAGVVLAEFLDTTGVVLGAETRTRPDTLVYGMGYPDGVPAERVARIRLSTRLTVHDDGDYLLAAAGVGHAHVTIDGQTLVEDDLIPTDLDAVIGLSRPPQAVLPLRMTAGVSVEVTYEYTPAPRTVAALRLGFAPAAPDPDKLIAEAVAVAETSDVSIMFVGTGPEDEGEGFDRDTLGLSGHQDALVRAVANVCPRTVVVVNAGAPVLMPWRQNVAAIVMAWFGGQEMGPAIADVLTGRAEPTGRLPLTIPTTEHDVSASPRPVDGDVTYGEGLDLGYRGYARNGIEPAFAFGHGLGYTTWKLGEPTAEFRDGQWVITLDVANTGHRRGRHIVQAYVTWPGEPAERPSIAYAASAVVELDPGTSTATTVSIPPRVLQRWDTDTHAWIDDEIATVHIGASSTDRQRVVTLQRPMTAQI